MKIVARYIVNYGGRILWTAGVVKHRGHPFIVDCGHKHASRAEALECAECIRHAEPGSMIAEELGKTWDTSMKTHPLCATKWPPDPEFKYGYVSAMSILGVTAVTGSRHDLEVTVETALQASLADVPWNEAERGAIEAMIWYWNHELEMDDNAVTIAAKGLLYPEPVMRY